MINNKVWFIIGVGCGMGVDIVKVVFVVGYKVVVIGRNLEKVVKVIGENENLLVVKLDVISLIDVEMVVKMVVECFGIIDVLVNNVGNFYVGYFEELSLVQIEK